MSQKFYTPGEEVANAVTHGIGTLCALAAIVVLSIFSALYGNTLTVVSVSIYGATLLVLYLSSTLYHAIDGEKAKFIFRVFDHCNIFLLIAGTYTPIVLSGIGGAFGWTVFGLVWAVAAVGIVLNAVDLQRYAKSSLLLYILMGWAIIFTFSSLKTALGMESVILLIAGGLSYTVGVLFFVLRKKYMHALWHLFVLAGSTLHFFAILWGVVLV
ncbi:MAG TPA: hemolysin III family protein [Clostridiales bacterium]|nr:hemolysin III family protein [Clostridiales bacterium]